jgi:hypothetical protein
MKGLLYFGVDGVITFQRLKLGVIIWLKDIKDGIYIVGICQCNLVAQALSYLTLISNNEGLFNSRCMLIITNPQKVTLNVISWMSDRVKGSKGTSRDETQETKSSTLRNKSL